jgi:hypothetical protein
MSANISRLFRFDRSSQSPGPTRHPIPGGCAHRVESAHRRLPPLVAAPCGLAPLPLLQTSLRKLPPTPLLPPTIRPHLLTALLHTGHSFASRHPPPPSNSELSDQTKRSASSPCPSYIKSLPAAPTSKAGQRDSLCHRFPKRATHWWQPSSVVPPPHRPNSKFRAAKELLPNHFFSRLGYSFGPSPVPLLR